MKKTIILGASTNTARYAYLAARDLNANGHEIVPVGIKKGEIFGREIINNKKIQNDVDTITLYLSPPRQKEWYEYILQTNPNRLIFNPGTENEDLAQLAANQGIDVEYACTLVMLSVGNY